MLHSPWRDTRWVVRSAALWLSVIKQRTHQQNQRLLSHLTAAFGCVIIIQLMKEELLLGEIFGIVIGFRLFYNRRDYGNHSEPLNPFHVVFGFVFYFYILLLTHLYINQRVLYCSSVMLLKSNQTVNCVQKKLCFI